MRAAERPAAPPADGPGSPPPLRLFVALWPPPRVQQALQAWQARWRWPVGAAVVAGERLHVTLHFLGAVPQAQVEPLLDALAAAAAHWHSFDLRLDRVECWPHGLWVLGPDSVPDGLRRLHGQIGDALRSTGLPVETRPFRPHVTLARHAAGAAGPPPPADLRWRVRGFALVQSERGYRTLRRFTRPAAGR